jgi:hypothetical protein
MAVGEQACVAVKDGGGPEGEEVPGTGRVEGRVEEVAVQAAAQALVEALEVVVAHRRQGERYAPEPPARPGVEAGQVVWSGTDTYANGQVLRVSAGPVSPWPRAPNP